MKRFEVDFFQMSLSIDRLETLFLIQKMGQFGVILSINGQGTDQIGKERKSIQTQDALVFTEHSFGCEKVFILWVVTARGLLSF